MLKNVFLSFTLLFSFCLVIAQNSTQNFGTGTGSHTSTTGSTSFIPDPSGSGTTYTRAGGGGTPSINLLTSSNPLGTSGSYVRASASSSGSVSKISPIVGVSSPSTQFYAKLKVSFADASFGTTATDGTWTIYFGDGAMYADALDFTNAQVFTGLRFTFGASGALTLNNRNGTNWNTTGLSTSTFNQAIFYWIEVIGNNQSSGTINYTYNGISQSVAQQRQDIYINGILIGDDINRAALTAGSNIASCTMIGISSTSNLANVYVDDVEFNTSIPASISNLSQPGNHNLSSSDYSFNSWASTSAIGSYPSNMVFHWGTVNTVDPALPNTATQDYVWGYNYTAQSRINGLGANGIEFINTSTGHSSTTSGNLGEAVIGLNTSGRNNIRVSWVAARQTNNGNRYLLRAQYRVGNSGSYTDLPHASISDIEFSSANAGPTSYGPITLPAACENQPIVQIRWVYYWIGSGSGDRDGIRLDDISVLSDGVNITTSTISGSPFCVGSTTTSSVSVSYSATGTYNSGNVFTAQLSNASGSFATPTDIGTLSSTSSGTISATIPASATAGTGYRIRVIASDPAVTGADNGSNLEIRNFAATSNPAPVCGNTTATASWTNPGCFDEMMLVVKSSAFTSALPTGDGTAYTANLTFGSGTVFDGGFVVYKGTATSSGTVSGLTNLTTYHFKTFARRGTTWVASGTNSCMPTPSTSSTDYFRSAATGNWNQTSTWQSSSDNTTWISATLTPTSAANTIQIRSGHLVRITANVTIDQVVIESGGTLRDSLAGDITTGISYTLNDGTGDDITIESGGVYQVKNPTRSGLPGGLGAFRVKSGGMIEVLASNSGGLSSLYASDEIWTANGSQDFSLRVTYETGSIFHWNSTAFYPSAAITYFPNVSSSVIPIFRVSNNATSGGGAANPTVINGVYDIASGFTPTWTNGGTKTFRNGITGAGNLTQTSSCGQILITGATAELSGTGTITLNTNGMRVQTGSNTTLQSNKTINATSGAGTFTLAGTLTAQNFNLNGTALFTLLADAKLITASPTGIEGSITLTGTKTFDNAGLYEFNILNANQATGNASWVPTVMKEVRVVNGSSLEFSKNSEIGGSGLLRIDGANSRLRAPNSRTLTIQGTTTFELVNSAKMNNNCLTNLTLTTGGNSSTATFAANGDTIKCFDFNSTKTTSGGVTLSANTTLYAQNNFTIDFGGTTTFTDNANTIVVGDDVRLKGASARYNFTGNLILTCENSGSGQADIEVESGNTTSSIQAQLNNLTINSTNSGANVRFQGLTGRNTITIKNNFTLQSIGTGRTVQLNSNILRIGGNWTNNVTGTSFSPGTSTVEFNGNTTQNINCTDTQPFYNLRSNKSSGTINLGNHIRVSDTLFMTNGNILPGTNLLELGTSTSNKGILSHSSGFVLGKMRRWYSGTNSGSASGLFPLGVNQSGIKNRFATIEYSSAATTGGHLTAEFVTTPMYLFGLPIAASMSGGAGFNVMYTSQEGYWIIDNQTGTLTDGLYSMSLRGDGISLITDLTKLTLLKRVNNQYWFAQGSHIAPSGSIAAPLISRSGMSGFSNFGFGGGLVNPLPVSLIDFQGECVTSGFEINWSTASETNNKEFELQISSNAFDYETVKTIEGAGNSNQIIEYNLSLPRQKSTSENYYFRLIQRDFNGYSETFGPIKLACSREDEGVTIQNISGIPNANISLSSAENFSLSLYELSGKIIFNTKMTGQKGSNLIALPELKLGIYIVRVNTPLQTFVKKIIIGD